MRLALADISWHLPGPENPEVFEPMIEVDRLNTEDGVALIREHQPPVTRTGCTQTSAAPKKPPPHASSSSY